MYGDIKASIAAAYNEHVQEREKAVMAGWKIQERERFMQQLASEHKQALLDIGSGPGHDGLFFQTHGMDVFCADLSEASVRLCKAKGLKAEAMSFEQLKFADCCFDAVWAMNCLLHVPKQELPAILLEVKRVMKKDALFYVGVYGGEDFEGVWEEDHYQPKRFFSFYEAQALKKILARFFSVASFSVVTPEIIGGKLEFQAFVLRK
ncbi:class I SAM-dependent methyltransferase [Shouchella clausii]|uniref:SAM-dependent methyltransferase n=2 Tax=Shouchella clausii TaxID=79880 RepID=A0A268P0X4_SHOCL|nr:MULTISPECIES: class I SAM-dependent methyltransferase [Shouchella]ALA53690.1 Methyltransferase [Shouchella clausii]MBU3229739.1 class I SAM-dependent methyltransferase [Shouchella clausii]MBU3264177.1 class I SAM-dependent methyltransferase [Shouchella clausii]MBU3506640.1 class I SAM-dependent methyltransferase [Shouchella clausii]MBU3536175.1 class I SAM-dependent methyltransferase [Shouchella clausii]